MHNLEYYGFSLLCYIQRECNSKFRKRRGFFEARDFSALGDSIVDYSKSSSAELDIVETLFGGSLSSEVVAAIGDAALEVGPGMVALLWQISQFTPDRKRSALAMVRGKTPIRGYLKSREDRATKWLAISVGDILERDVEYLVEVGSIECEQLCLKFMDLVRERGLPVQR